MNQKTFIFLENNPVVVNHLAYQLGLSKNLAFYDVYSLHDEEMLSLIPRPVYALLAIIPMTETWNKARKSEDSEKELYGGSGPSEAVVWFKQTIRHACGSIGLLHCLFNSPEAVNNIIPDSDLDKIFRDAIPLKMAERSQMLHDSEPFEIAHAAAAVLGDTIVPGPEDPDGSRQHFVAFVKAKDGHLWELEGSRKGPLDRGLLKADEDALSEQALKLGLGRLMDMEKDAGGDLHFSCIALAPSFDC